MTSGVVTPHAKSPFMAAVDKLSGQRMMSCYQCGKCTAGCPVAATVPLGPRQVMRSIQMGLRDQALGSLLIWLCLSCQTCTARCPREIDVAGVMETLRLMAVAENHPVPERDLAVFHKVFLSSVKRGRVFEFGIGTFYNLLTLRPFKNLSLLPKLLAKRKLELAPSSPSGGRDVKAIFQRVAAMQRQALAVSPDGKVTKLLGGPAPEPRRSSAKGRGTTDG